MDQAQVQVRIVVNDAGGGVGGGAGGSAGQSNTGPGAAARQPVGMASANVRNATLSADDLRQLKDLIIERRRAATQQRGSVAKTDSGDGEKAKSNLELMQNLARSVYGLNPSLGSVGEGLTAAGELIGGRVGSGLQLAGAGATKLQALAMFVDTFKLVVGEITPVIMTSVLAAMGIDKNSAFFKSVMASSADISQKITDVEIIDQHIQTAFETTRSQAVARARLGGAVDAASVSSLFEQNFQVSKQRDEIEQYIKRDVKQDKVFDIVNALRSAALAKLGN